MWSYEVIRIEEKFQTKWKNINLVRQMKMKVFRKIQANLEILGINKNQAMQMQNHPYNGKILMDLLILSYSIASHFLYILYDAKSFDEYIECICAISASILITTCFAAMVFKMTTLFELIERKEDLIATSE